MDKGRPTTGFSGRIPSAMAATIAVVSDTHCLDWEEVHPDIRSALSEADVAVHCGDFTRMSVVEGLRRVARKAVMQILKLSLTQIHSPFMPGFHGHLSTRFVFFSVYEHQVRF